MQKLKGYSVLRLGSLLYVNIHRILEVVDPYLADRSLPREESFSHHSEHLHGAFSDVYIPIVIQTADIHTAEDDVLAA